MLAALLKALELLLNAINTSHSTDKKRASIAKELSNVYRQLRIVTERGESILSVIEQPSTAYRGVALHFLTEQVQAIQELRDALVSGTVGTLVNLHMPSETKELICALNMKAGMVWFTLDQLVSGGQKLNNQEWVDALARRMHEIDDKQEDKFYFYPDYFDVQRLENVPEELTERYERQLRFSPEQRTKVQHPLELATALIIASPEEISQGREILSCMTRVGERLRTFIIEKFTVEDFL